MLIEVNSTIDIFIFSSYDYYTFFVSPLSTHTTYTHMYTQLTRTRTCTHTRTPMPWIINFIQTTFFLFNRFSKPYVYYLNLCILFYIKRKKMEKKTKPKKKKKQKILFTFKTN